ncbi:D-alanyl-D-alanine carboxypeptidase [Minicystis rosea]|nr:D-alanyl-D-alanine carboxypeptidase [Minicystis rosea]
MHVVSASPLRVASIVFQPRRGAFALTVVCKATFQLEPDVCRLAVAQEDPIQDDILGESGLRAPSDLVPMKPRADVILVGHAFAPGGQPARTVRARLVVGEIDKSIDVFCDRIFWQDGRLLEGQPFTQMPISYGRAAFGPENPAGVRFDAPPDASGAVRIPNLQPQGSHIARRGDTFAPVGFGPIAPSWPGRVEKLRQHAGTWSLRSLREWPLPAEIDPSFFNVAPRDQQMEAIQPDERIILENLSPAAPRLETCLPGIQPIARMTAGGRAGEGMALVADTLTIDTDRSIVTVVWRGRVPLNHPDESGQLVVTMEGGDLPGGTAILGGEAHPGTVQLGPGGVAPPMRTPFAAPSGEIETLLGGSGGGPALPFTAAGSPWVGFRPKPPPPKDAPLSEGTGTVYGVKGKARDVLPFPDAAPRVPPSAAFAPMIDVVTPEPPAPEVREPEAPETPPPPEPEPTPKADIDISIELCAAIQASIDRSGGQKKEVLEKHALSDDVWSAAAQRWEADIDTDVEQGKTDLLQRYDAAYIAQIEEERGPIRPEDYARLSVAAERGTTDAVLTELSIPEEAEMRLERVWLDKVLRSPALAKQVREARAKASAEA